MAKKKRQVRNKTRDMFADYYKTNKEYARENREREERESGEDKPKGLQNLTYREKTYIVVIVLGLIGIVVRYLILPNL